MAKAGPGQKDHWRVCIDSICHFYVKKKSNVLIRSSNSYLGRCESSILGDDVKWLLLLISSYLVIFMLNISFYGESSKSLLSFLSYLNGYFQEFLN